MYSLIDYGAMVADRLRTDAYAQALRQTVSPGSVVLDIGTGIGIWALLACQFGARRVYAIEPDDVIQVAREIAAANGYAQRIEFIQNMSTQVTLPEQVDVIVAEIHGVLPLFRQSAVSIADARRRLLAPGGNLIPQYETLWVAVVEAPELYSRYRFPWDDNCYGLELRAVLPIVTNIFRKGRVKPEQLLVKPHSWAVLDYATLESPNVSGEATWTVARPATGHGLIVWFDATLAEGVGLSNAPGKPELIFGSLFFPWSELVTVAVGDTVSLTLNADLVGEDYIWRWDSLVLDQGYPGQVKANFKQSTLFGAPLSPARMRKQADSHVPALNEDGRIDQFVLALMDGEMPLGEIAGRVQDRFPKRFAKWQDALTRVGDLSQKYSR